VATGHLGVRDPVAYGPFMLLGALAATLHATTIGV
jgi:hypothetical protein